MLVDDHYWNSAITADPRSIPSAVRIVGMNETLAPRGRMAAPDDWLRAIHAYGEHDSAEGSLAICAYSISLTQRKEPHH